MELKCFECGKSIGYGSWQDYTILCQQCRVENLRKEVRELDSRLYSLHYRMYHGVISASCIMAYNTPLEKEESILLEKRRELRRRINNAVTIKQITVADNDYSDDIDF